MGGPLRNISASHAGSYLNMSNSEREFERFRRNVSELRSQLNNGGVKDILHSFHKPSVLLVEMNKTFNIDNKNYTFPFALQVAELDGHVWDGLDDVVVRESNGVSETVLLKSETSVQVLSSFRWPRDSFSIPLESGIISLYRWDIVRWAMGRKDKILENIRQIVLPNTKTFINFLNEEDTNLSISTTLGDTASHGTRFTTVSKLREKVGNKSIEALPEIAHLRFAKQLDKDFLPLRLQFGQGYNNENILCHIWIYFKLVPGVCPHMDIVLGGPIDNEGDENLNSPEQSHQLSYTPEQSFKMLQDEDMILLRIFQPLQNVNEMRAFAKFCFILAAEDPSYTFTNHFIPFNKTFADHLKKVCERFLHIPSDFYTVPTSLPRIQPEEPESRGTNNSIVAAQDAEQTGLSFLPDDHVESILEQDAMSQSSFMNDTQSSQEGGRDSRSEKGFNVRPDTVPIGSILDRKTNFVPRGATERVPKVSSATKDGNPNPQKYPKAARRPFQTARVSKNTCLSARNKAVKARLKHGKRKLLIFIKKVPSLQEALRKCRQRHARKLKTLDSERTRRHKEYNRELMRLLTIEPPES